MSPRLPSWIRSRKSMPEVLAYRRALATTSRRLAVRKASLASRPLRSRRRSSISCFLSLNSPFSIRIPASSPDSIIWASSTSCSAVSNSYSPMAVRYCETRSVVRRPRSSVILLTTDFLALSAALGASLRVSAAVNVFNLSFGLGPGDGLRPRPFRFRRSTSVQLLLYNTWRLYLMPRVADLFATWERGDGTADLAVRGSHAPDDTMTEKPRLVNPPFPCRS